MYFPLHSCIHHNSLHVDRSSTENTDLDQFVKMSFVSNEGMIKWKMLALNLEIYKSMVCPKLVIHSHLKLEQGTFPLERVFMA